MIDTFLCGIVGIVTVIIALAISILLSRRSGQRQAPSMLKLLVTLIVGATVSVGACTFLGYIAYSASPSPIEAQLHPERATAASGYIAAWVILTALICGAVGLGLVYWLKSPSKAQSPKSTEGMTEHCPRCGTQVSPADQNCPSCRINLAFAREHPNQL